MAHQVFDDGDGILHDIDIPPIDPFVLRLQRRIKQIVPRSADSFASRTLCFEAMSVFDTLGEVVAEVLFDDHGTAVAGGVAGGLKLLEMVLENVESVIFAISDQEGEVDGLVRVGQFLEELEIGFQM